MTKKEEEFEAKEERGMAEGVTATGRDPFEDLAKLTSSQIIKSAEPLPLECPVCELMNPALASSCASCGYSFQENLNAIAFAADEQLCPRCHKVVKKEASECRYCGYSFDAGLQAKRALRQTEEEIEKMAKAALKSSLIGLLCLSGIVFGPLFLFAAIFGFGAVSSGWGALAAISKLRRDNPGYKLETSARGKALTGIALGGIELILGVIYLAVTIIGLINQSASF